MRLRRCANSRLRAAGHTFQFGIEVQPSGGTFTQYASMSNRSGPQTRIYGASGTDFRGADPLPEQRLPILVKLRPGKSRH